jgi:RNA polymerase sigma-70 factor (ECF subfamily)
MVAVDVVRHTSSARPTPLIDPPTAVSDAALVRRIRAGDERALELVFRAHYAGMAAFVQRYVYAPDVAEELVQDIFFKLWSRREQLSEIESFKTYLYRAVRNQALNWLRRRKLERRWEEEHGEESEPTALAAADDGATEQEVTLAVRAAIDRLPPRCREIFLLSRDGRLTYNDIARTLEISVKTVETQMGRALRALRTSLASYRDPE